jgi:hypothetical protein
MQTPHNSAIVHAIRRVVSLLVSGDYRTIEKLTAATRLDAEVISRAIYEYGHTLVVPPDSAFENLDVIEVHESTPKRWSVRVNLWTEEEGCSDLSLELTLIESKDSDMLIEVDNLHVL